MDSDNKASVVNTAARKKRHHRIELISPLLKNWGNIEKALSPREKKVEKSFFWRVTSLGVLSFFVFSLFPQLLTTEANFWEVTYLPVNFAPDDEVGMVEEGFLVKPEIISTSDVDRSGLTDAIEYAVKSGDTLSGIAQTFGVTTRTLLDNNSLSSPNALKTGQILKIPPVNGLIYTVQKGDTLDKIATKYKVEKEKVIAQNDLSAEAELEEGKDLIIPGVKKSAPPRVYTARTTGSSAAIFGTAPNISGGTASHKLLWPCGSCRQTQGFRYGHYALDLAISGGTTIYAAADGVVEVAKGGWSGGYGNHIIIDHGNGMKTLYAHNKELYVVVGQRVSQGQPIAFMGNTGRVYGRTGIHLHFEVRVNGKKVNPYGYL